MTTAARKTKENAYRHLLHLTNGQTLYVELPPDWIEVEGGETFFLPPAVRYLDRLKALATPLDLPGREPSPGHLAALRAALKLSRPALAKHLGVTPAEVARWERGRARPSPRALATLERLRKRNAKAGIIV